MHEQSETLTAAVKERWESTNPDGSANTKKPNAAFRSSVARDLFQDLPEEERAAYADRAVAEAAAAKATYATTLKNGPSKSPEARQK
jgi:hypothetical protein